MDLNSLLILSKKGCYKGFKSISSSEFAQDLDTSQQTASRRLKELEDEELIAREILPKGQKIKITNKGVETLRSIYHDMKSVFEDDGGINLRISGEVGSGMGEGRYYMQIPGYAEQFQKMLGFLPYPGTLNLRLKTDEDMKMRHRLLEMKGIDIEGFKHNDRVLGSVKCFMIEIEGIKGAIVIPARTHHTIATLEIISPLKIREKLDLKDGDIVTVKVFL